MGATLRRPAPEPAHTLPADGVVAGTSYRNDTSPPLREMEPQPFGFGGEREANENPKVPLRHVDSPDGAVQGMHVPFPSMPGTGLNFDGIPYPGVGCSCAPPDTDGEVGLAQYVQLVNEGIQVFDKASGASTFGPVGISTLWSGFGGVCQNNGHGDPIVIYDQLANRWVISQFAGTGNPTDECIAVSTTSDATGSYYRYGFHLGTNYFDYPKLAVWPDAYYMSMVVFNAAGTAYVGPQPFAFDRVKMLAGLAATFVSPGNSGTSYAPYNPADLDGSTLPAAGAPATFVEFPWTGAFRVFHFHADFAVPGNSTFTLFASPASAGFTSLCPGTRACVPQKNSANNLDGVGDRLMHRLAYRNFGSFESVVGNFSVRSGSGAGVAGIRWFELRNVIAGPVTVAQQSTYQPDTTWRWMGSAAQDNAGNLALGFSASSLAIDPQIRYAGRLATDPVNTLGQGEAHLHDGTGSQTFTSNRWGDYSALSIDPVDDCTFWYTQEYYSTTGSFNWRTRIGNFKFTECTAVPPPPTPTNTPTSTPVPPTATRTPTNTPVPPTATRTPTNTSVPPTATRTNTPVPPTNTPTNTPVPPTATRTNTPVPPTNTPTNTPVPPTATFTPTNTPVPPTNTPANSPTNTPVPPTATFSPTATPTATFTPTSTPIPTVTPTAAIPSPRPMNVDGHGSGTTSNLNGVLESGETVVVAPAWQNSTTVPLTFTGAASGITGPAGPSYAIADGSADYGTVGIGGLANCYDATAAHDCYRMTVSGVRPAPHWDATFDESLSLPYLKNWKLHVGESFADVPTSQQFYAFIENIFHNGITGGCGAGVYCPANSVTRAQMAVFLLKAKHGAGYVPPSCTGVFTDVACPSQFADWIEELAAEQITGGCGAGIYCPDNPVTRAQIAAFLLKAKYGSAYVPPNCTGVFSDVVCPSLFADWIEELATEGITGGCGAGIYCPANPNTRGQMAVFLVKTFGLALYGP